MADCSEAQGHQGEQSEEGTLVFTVEGVLEEPSLSLDGLLTWPEEWHRRNWNVCRDQIRHWWQTWSYARQRRQRGQRLASRSAQRRYGEGRNIWQSEQRRRQHGVQV